jgi:hypothetical protein
MTTKTKLAAGTALSLFGLSAAALAFPTTAFATEGHEPAVQPVYVQNYSDSCELPNRTSQFVLDALGADTPTTYTISDGTPPVTVVVAPHSVDRSPVFSIPASGASYQITASTGQTWGFTAAADCIPVVEEPVVVTPAPTPTPEPTPEVPVEEETPAPETPAPTPEPEKEVKLTTVLWEVPGLGEDGDVTYPQKYITADAGGNLSAFDDSALLECDTTYQVDVYDDQHGDPADLWKDGVLTDGEDKPYLVDGDNAKVFTTDECEVPPVTEEPTHETPVDETPVTTPVVDKPVVEEAVVVQTIVPAKTPIVAKAATVPSGSLAFTGPLEVGTKAGLAGIALVAGIALTLFTALRRRQVRDEQ